MYYFSNYFEWRFTRRWVALIGPLFFVVFTHLIDASRHSRLGIYMIALVMVLEMKAMFKMNINNAIYAGLTSVLLVYSLRGILSGITALAMNQGIDAVIGSEPTRYPLYIGSYLLVAFLLLMLLRVKKWVNNIKKLYRNYAKMRSVIIFEGIMILYLLIINDGRFIETHSTWFAVVYLSSCCFVLLMLILIWSDAVRVSALLEQEKYSAQLETQLDLQLAHYESYASLMKEYRKFRHDFKNIQNSIQTLIAAQQYQEVIKLFQNIETDIDKKLDYKVYSKNSITDAIIQHTKEVCKLKNIQLTVDMYLPNVVSVTPLNILRVSNNMINNAIEATEQIPDIKRRFIRIQAKADDRWIRFEISNSYQHAPKVVDGEYLSIKKDKGVHGLGLKIIKEIIEESGGFMKILIDEQQQIFTLKTYVPYVEKKD